MVFITSVVITILSGYIIFQVKPKNEAIEEKMNFYSYKNKYFVYIKLPESW